MFTSGTWQNRAVHVVIAAIAFGLPLATLAFPHWQDITLGMIVLGAYHLLEAKFGN